MENLKYIKHSKQTKKKQQTRLEHHSSANVTLPCAWDKTFLHLHKQKTAGFELEVKNRRKSAEKQKICCCYSCSSFNNSFKSFYR